MDLRLCKKCNVLKQRISSGNFNNKDKKFVDENGWLWHGSCCPSCNLIRVREKMKTKREKKDVTN